MRGAWVQAGTLIAAAALAGCQRERQGTLTSALAAQEVEAAAGEASLPQDSPKLKRIRVAAVEMRRFPVAT